MDEIPDNVYTTRLPIERENLSSNNISDQQEKTGNEKGSIDNIVISYPQSQFLEVPEPELTPNAPKALENENLDTDLEGNTSFFVSASDIP